MSTKLTITRENGNIPRTLAGQDHISGFMAYILSTEIPAAFKTAPVQAVSTIDAAEKLGITADAKVWTVKMLHYQLSEIFRLNKGIVLYVGIFEKKEMRDYSEMKVMQNYALGAIRQIGIWDGTTAPTTEVINAVNAMAEKLDEQNAPVSVLYAPNVSAYKSLPSNLAGSAPRVSVVVAQDGGGVGAALYSSVENKTKASVSAIGVALGTLSLAKVHQCIAWVRQFPSGISMPALGDGKLIRDIDKADLEKLDTERYLFLVPQVGIAGSYWNDSHNCDVATSDYASIESVRTMDKAIRGIRTYVTPELGGNVYVDGESGKMEVYTVEHLESVANIALDQMAAAGELSGYVAEVDPEQNVLASSTVEIIIKNLPVGVIRKMNVKIGFTKKL